jgi:hypothetical protein
MAHFRFTSIADWPPLAWLARCDARTGEVSVLHGPRVETATEWFCEAAWDGEYALGDFDRTDIVAGSGGRLRDDAVTFVAPGSTVDRLHSFEGGGIASVSNSLPCLLAAIGGEVDPTHRAYGAFFHSIVRGLHKVERWLRTSVGPVQLVYFDNLRWADGVLSALRKPLGARMFADFTSYRSFLARSMFAIMDNALSSRRTHGIRPLSTLSSGYDSTTVSVLARQAGLQEVITFTKGFSGPTLGEATTDDSGRLAAQVLGLRYHSLDPVDRTPLDEVPFFAANAWGEDAHYLRAARHLGGRLLFTGYHGDKVWSKAAPNLSANIVRGDLSGLSLTEFRLWAGFLHCPVPFWGVRSIAQIDRISNSPEMKPWDVPGNYSRPICRRIAEEAGIPRDAFGIRKLASAAWPLSRRSFLTASSSADYVRWLRAHRGRWMRSGRVPPPTSLPLDRAAMSAARLLEEATERVAWSVATRSGWSALPHHPAIKALCTLTHPDSQDAPWVPVLRRHVFPWAIAHAKARYAVGT